MDPPYRQVSSAHDRYCVYIRVRGSRAAIRPVSDGPSVRVALSMYEHSTPAAVAGTKNDMATLAPVLITRSYRCRRNIRRATSRSRDRADQVPAGGRRNVHHVLAVQQRPALRTVEGDPPPVLDAEPRHEVVQLGEVAAGGGDEQRGHCAGSSAAGDLGRAVGGRLGPRGYRPASTQTATAKPRNSAGPNTSPLITSVNQCFCM